LRFNFVVAAHMKVRFTPQFLRALHLELFTKPSVRRGWELAEWILSAFGIPNRNPICANQEGG
jgi:hypothetical protein